MFIEVTGARTGIKYYLNPNKISAMHAHEDTTRIYTDRLVNGNTLMYEVVESEFEILCMIDMDFNL